MTEHRDTWDARLRGVWLPRPTFRPDEDDDMAKKATHNPNLPEHRTVTEAAAAFPIFKLVYQKRADVDIGDGGQALCVIGDYASSFAHKAAEYSGPPMSEDEAMAALETHLTAAKGGAATAIAVPWALVFQLLLAALQHLFGPKA